ncbi:MAG: hypothetical protein ACI311_05615 [Bacilli bacterium]
MIDYIIVIGALVFMVTVFTLYIIKKHKHQGCECCSSIKGKDLVKEYYKEKNKSCSCSNCKK